MADSCGDPLRHLGRNGSFWQQSIFGFDLGAWANSGFDVSREEESE
jgi:hypothetical protein